MSSSCPAPADQGAPRRSGPSGPAGRLRAEPVPGGEAVHHPTSGIPSHDRIALSAPAPPVTEVCAPPGGLALLVPPQMPEVRRIAMPPQGVGVAVRMADRVEPDAAPAPGIAARVQRRDMLRVPAGFGTVWTAAGGMPAAIHRHIPEAVRARRVDGTGEPGPPLPLAATPVLRGAGVTPGRARRVRAFVEENLAEIAPDRGFATRVRMTGTFRRATGLPPARRLRAHGRKEAGDLP